MRFRLHTNGCSIQVVTSEEQFRAEGRKLAAHLAEPDVEVSICQLVHMVLYCFYFIPLQTLNLHVGHI